LFRSPLDVPIIHILYQLYSSFHALVIKFPKSERYSLGSSIQSQILSLFESVIGAASVNNTTLKAAKLSDASIKLDLLRLLIRLAKDCKCLSNEAYLKLESDLHQSGKMLGGWLKSIK